MSKTRWISALAASLGILVAACWFVTATFPLAAAPQVVNDSPGVTVDLGGANLLHRDGVAYPAAARKAHVGGTVSVEVKTDASGNVSDAHVLSGPDELRRAVVTSVLGWHFAASSAGATRVVNVNFAPPREEPVAASEAPAAMLPAPPAMRSAAEQAAPAAAPKPTPVFVGRTVKTINIIGLSDSAKQDLLAKLPVHEGDTMSVELAKQTQRAVAEFDEHLLVATGLDAAGNTALTIAAPNSAPAEMRLKIGGSVQQTKLVKQVRPVYPPEAKAAHIQGVVHMEAIIGADGTVKRLDLISGEPILAQAAMEAVRQWVYQTTLLNGNPVEVQTSIDVNFTLTQ